MKILVIYESRTGTTEDCIGLMRKNLTGLDVTVCNIREGKPDIDGYGMILLGGSVRYGKLPKKLRRFIGDNSKELIEKSLGLFFCCGFPQNEEMYEKALFPSELTAHAFAVSYFGGEMRYNRVHGFSKLMVYMVRSHILTGGDNGTGAEDESLPSILEGNISRFADAARVEACGNGV